MSHALCLGIDSVMVVRGMNIVSNPIPLIPFFNPCFFLPGELK